ncbi:hypothetical protein TEQG_00305 [Trichophyton equinum CBS 127.97]|uniref:Uncharacterized protein n=1 Tax=Trichophyton equinum (strain ATCC MYA-4606 / CBS 127.97) TaxID=559882 RepID=F2PH84_TRIEC|nr:hypothetical protein TEQG_00305 [Trichophyton equinum CBS 127.97]
MSPVFWRRRTLRRAASSAPAAPGTGSATAARLWKSLSERLCSEKTALSSAASRGWCFRSRGCRSGSPETRARQRATRARKLSRRAILRTDRSQQDRHRRILRYRDRGFKRKKNKRQGGGFMYEASVSPPAPPASLELEAPATRTHKNERDKTRQRARGEGRVSPWLFRVANSLAKEEPPAQLFAFGRWTSEPISLPPVGRPA